GWGRWGRWEFFTHPPQNSFIPQNPFGHEYIQWNQYLITSPKLSPFLHARRTHGLDQEFAEDRRSGTPEHALQSPEPEIQVGTHIAGLWNRRGRERLPGLVQERGRWNEIEIPDLRIHEGHRYPVGIGSCRGSGEPRRPRDRGATVIGI